MFQFQRYGRESPEKHLPFAVHILKGNIKVFCNTLLFVYAYLMISILLIVHFINFVAQFLKIPNLAVCHNFS